ncbi:MAG: queuosine precursor transporter [Bacilli bacterium]
MNEFLWILTLLLSFISVILCYKYIGKNGLFLWIVVATLVSNIQTVKTVELFGIETSLGTILYGSTFLATDILNYKYGLNESRKTIKYGFIAMIIMTLFMVICLMYKPSASDFAQESLTTIFSFNIRITIGSLVAFAVSQFLDTLVFHKLQSKYKKLWLSNNVSTMLCQIVDTIIFVLITYFGTMSLNVMLEIMLSMYIFKVMIALLDTPCMYLASKIKKVNND